jgi:hypothetical protein
MEGQTRVPLSALEQIVGRERNQRACHRQLVRNVVDRRRVNSTVRRHAFSSRMAVMPKVRIVVTTADDLRSVIRELTVDSGSAKSLTARRAARVLAQIIPGFRRRKGTYARQDGVAVLPAMEPTDDGWCAWRLKVAGDEPSGYEPPIRGRVGKLNSTNNPFADRKRGTWERAEVSELCE